MSNYVISVDLGGTNILAALIDKENNIIEREKKTTDIKAGGDGIVKSISESIKNLIEKTKLTEEKIKGLCIGVPGIINPFEGIIYNAPNLFLKDYNIKNEFRKYLNLPVYIENDVNLAGLGIKRKEYNNEVKNMLVLFIGTGIGAAIILNGKLYRGSTFFAGEAGHMMLNTKKIRNSDNNISFENFASRTAIVKRITDDIKKGKKSVLKDLVLEDKRIKSRTLANALFEGDKVVVEHVSESCKIIGNVLGNIQTLMNFDTIVLGGGVIEAMGNFMVAEIEKSFHKFVFDKTGKDIKIIPTGIGDDAPLYGGWEVINEGYELNIK